MGLCDHEFQSEVVFYVYIIYMPSVWLIFYGNSTSIRRLLWAQEILTRYAQFFIPAPFEVLGVRWHSSPLEVNEEFAAANTLAPDRELVIIAC